MLAKWWRILRWWWRCLWEGKVLPRKLEGGLYSRSYMRRAWRNRLRSLDRAVNDWKIRGKDPILMLMERRIMVVKRRAFRFD